MTTQALFDQTEMNMRLLDELEKANRIIHNALQIMTQKQMMRWSVANARDSVDGEGSTRRNERDATIARAKELLS